MALRYDGGVSGVEGIDISEEGGQQPSSEDEVMIRLALHVSHFCGCWESVVRIG
jgi:hypothetical protein